MYLGFTLLSTNVIVLNLQFHPPLLASFLQDVSVPWKCSCLGKCSPRFSPQLFSFVSSVKWGTLPQLLGSLCPVLSLQW